VFMAIDLGLRDLAGVASSLPERSISGLWG
jgi:hypothetical protein